MAVFLPLHDYTTISSTTTTSSSSEAEDEEDEVNGLKTDKNSQPAAEGSSVPNYSPQQPDDEGSLPLDTTYLAEGYTEDGRLTRYDNVPSWYHTDSSRNGRRNHHHHHHHRHQQQQQQQQKKKKQQNVGRESSFSSSSSSSPNTILDSSSRVFNNKCSAEEGNGNGNGAVPRSGNKQMIGGGGGGGNHRERRDSAYSRIFSNATGSPPLSPSQSMGRRERRFSAMATGCFARSKFWYDHSAVRHVGPFLLLALYAVIGAWIFYMIEHDHEVWLHKREQEQLGKLRNETFFRLKRVFGQGIRRTIRQQAFDPQQAASGEVLKWYEKQVIRIKVPDTIEWDGWGALFYVGTVFTTIGYGNITPRTKSGQALSILYAIIGIPLVLAILNQFSKKLTRWLSYVWMRYLKCRHRSTVHTQRRLSEIDPEKGGQEAEEPPPEEENIESKTIPVWLALSLCICYVCLIAAIFLIWETRWTYFTSFYFICISCLTIGLGDITPDHPHMLILMFVFVILGLSLVSMLLSVIQIKMEEWLYRMMIKMHKEFQKKLEEATNPEEREKILAELLKDEPWYMRNLAPMLMSENKAEEIEQLAENYDRVLRETNNKMVQTDSPLVPVEIDWKPQNKETGLTSMVSEENTDAPMVSAQEYFGWTGQKQPGVFDHFPKKQQQENVGHGTSTMAEKVSLTANSISDALSLPMDSTNFNTGLLLENRSIQADVASLCDHSMQTEIAQFQIDELAVKLRNLHQEKEKSVPKRFPTMDRGSSPKSEAEKQKQVLLVEQTIQTERPRCEDSEVQVKPRLKDKSVGTKPQSFDSRGTLTDFGGQQQMVNRSMETLNGGLWRGEEFLRSRATQTTFDDDDEDGDEADLSEASRKRRKDRRLSAKHKMDEFEEDEEEPRQETGVQCSLPLHEDICDVATQTSLLLEPPRSSLGGLLAEDEEFISASKRSSAAGLLELPDGIEGDMARECSDSILGTADCLFVWKPPVIKQDLVVQTDDSYLKIARRLNEYRTNTAPGFQVYATPLPRKNLLEAEPEKDLLKPSGSRRSKVSIQEPDKDTEVINIPSATEASGSGGGGIRRISKFLEPAAQRIRQSMRRRQKPPRTTTETPMGDEEDEMERHRTPSPKRPSTSSSVGSGSRKSSSAQFSGLDGRVNQFVKLHERGIHNPGTPDGQRSQFTTVVDLRPPQQQRGEEEDSAADEVARKISESR